MPELPEVETVRNVLSPFITGQTIKKVTINLKKVVANLTPAQFSQQLTGQTIANVTRRGKFLTLHLQSGAHVVIHLRMTGTLIVEKSTVPIVKHTNLILTFTNGTELRFIDSRGFGHWWYFTPQQPDTSGQKLLGPEPEQVTADYLQQKIANRHAAIKTLLLDQHIIAGIGNIYADEICFRAGIQTTRPGCSLTRAEIQRLTKEIAAVIAEFIQFHHLTFEVYAQSKGTSYQNDANLRVYGRAGQPCLRCGKTLVGTRVGQRSSVYCPHCQK